MKVPARRQTGNAAEQRGEVDKAPRNKVAHMAAAVLVALPLALHRQQARAQQRVALVFVDPHTFPDDDVDRAGFVFQRNEDGALGRARLLAADD